MPAPAWGTTRPMRSFPTAALVALALAAPAAPAAAQSSNPRCFGGDARRQSYVLVWLCIMLLS